MICKYTILFKSDNCWGPWQTLKFNFKSGILQDTYLKNIEENKHWKKVNLISKYMDIYVQI